MYFISQSLSLLTLLLYNNNIPFQPVDTIALLSDYGILSDCLLNQFPKQINHTATLSNQSR